MGDNYRQWSVQRLNCELAQRDAVCGIRKIDLIERWILRIELLTFFLLPNFF